MRVLIFFYKNGSTFTVKGNPPSSVNGLGMEEDSGATDPNVEKYLKTRQIPHFFILMILPNGGGGRKLVC